MDDFEELWQSSERQYQSNSQELQSIIRVLPTISQSQRDDYLQQGNECLSNLDRAITDLTQALRQNRSSTQKDRYRQQLNVYKQQIKSQRQNFKLAVQKQRYNSYSVYEKEERKKLLQGNEIIDSTQNALNQSKQIVAETEDIAIDTSGKVNQQGQQLENVLSDVNEINDTSARARRIMLGMARRMMTDRIIQFIIVFLELGIIGGLLYWKFGT
mmetsp:Transcript_61895/g.55852  ORF Transcript_61895/g.55852 Transcript_61895/m.55852 type:complete len:214 (+) Transcript_61895:47-688(+)